MTGFAKGGGREGGKKGRKGKGGKEGKERLRKGRRAESVKGRRAQVSGLSNWEGTATIN